ncbi:MAG: filamentous hemagglutinin N-terminal domain-containing protein [Candidatus Pacebacteria bacterium]|nr:filamentous hemagglutinin N-terminal domain-containing protein [Candidatus Paceibacterota bacterium]
MQSTHSPFNVVLSRKPLVRVFGSVAVAAVLAFTPQGAKAAPQGGTVEKGSALISTEATATIIRQSSDRAVIAWDSFNLSANESVDFIVPNAQGATLNRINDSQPSTISGTITSNGAVYFTNPNGLIFDATSRVTANGFFAATQTIGDSVFMNSGVTRTSLTNLGTATINLDGAITAPAITVMAHTVKMNGSLESPRGDILVSSTHWTSLGAGAVISADAAQNGDGGKVIIWSDNHTDFLGNISARGGSTSGDGGFVEVSGKKTLNFDGIVDTTAAHGKTGTLLLDPENIDISSNANNLVTTTGSTTYSAGGGNNTTLNVNTLTAALRNNNVTVDATINNTGYNYGAINIKTSITSTSTNTLTLKAGPASTNLVGPGSGTIIQDSGTTISLAGTLNLQAGGAIQLQQTGNRIEKLGTVTGGATVAIYNNGNMSLNGNITGGGGNDIIIDLTQGSTGSGTLTLNSNVTASNGGKMVIILGSGGALDVTASHRYINTSNMNLQFNAGSISNSDTTNPIFKLGTGGLTLSGGVAESIDVPNNITYTSTTSGVTDAKVGDLYNNLTGNFQPGTYRFSGSVAISLSATVLSATPNIANILNLPGSLLAASTLKIGTKTTVTTGSGAGQTANPGFSAGLKRLGSGDVIRRTAVAAQYTTIDVNLLSGQAMKIDGVNTAAANVTTFAPSSITFSGTNSFTAAVSLTATGAISIGGTNSFSTGLTLTAGSTITQTGGTITVSGGNLKLTSTGAISLAQTGNSLGTIGQIDTQLSGGVTIWNKTDLRLNGSISATGPIEINTNKNIVDASHPADSANGKLTLASLITFSGGDVTINLGTGALDVTSGHNYIETSNKNLNITAGSVTNSDSTTQVFRMKSDSRLDPGTLTTNLVNSSATPYTNTYTGIVNETIDNALTDGTITTLSFGASDGTYSSGDTLNLDGSRLASATGKKIGTKTVKTNNPLNAGLKAPTGTNVDYVWQNEVAVTTATNDYTLPTGKAMVIDGVTTAATGFTDFAPSSLTFRGTNSFTGNVITINIAGDITQASGTISMTGASPTLNLLSTNGSITLNQTGNDLKKINLLSATSTSGAATTITIWNKTDLTLSGNITAGGAIEINTTKNAAGTANGKLTVANPVTFSGGNVIINLGTGALDVTAAHNYIDTGNKNLTLTAGTISNGTATDPVFKLKSGSGTAGTLTLSGTLQLTSTKNAGTSYTGLATEAIETAITGNTITTYSFAGTGNTASLSNGILSLPTDQLAKGLTIGTKVVITTPGDNEGLKTNATDGEYVWQADNSPSPTTTDIDLSAGKAMVIAGVTNSAAQNVTAFAPSSITLSGTNSFDNLLNLVATGAISFSGNNTFNGGLTLSAGGAISQTGGTITLASTKTLRMTTTNGSISLNQVGNDLQKLGGGLQGITATGTVTIWNSTDLTLNGNISAGGAIEIDTTKNAAGTANGKLTLGTANIETEGGAVTINLGTGAFDVSASHYSLDTKNNNLTLTAGSIANGSTSAIFKLKSGSAAAGVLTLNGTVKLTTLKQTGIVYGGYATAEIDAAITGNTISTYSFAGNGTSASLSNGTLNLPGSQLATGVKIGDKTTVTVAGNKAGLKESATAGEFVWQEDTANTESTNPVNLTSGKAMVIAGVTSAVADVTVFAPTTISFSGNNSFSNALSLTATGAISFSGTNSFAGLTLSAGGTITQSGGTITLTAGDLTLTAVGGISLNQTGNSLRSLGVITNNTNGNIEIKNSAAALAVNGNITGAAGTTITIDTTGSTSNHLTLSKAIESDGGNLILKIGGNYNPATFAWKLNSKTLSITTNGWGGDNTPNTFIEAFTLVSTLVYANLTPKAASGGLDPTVRNYFTTLTKGSQAYQDALAEIRALDENAVLNSIADMTLSASATGGFEIGSLTRTATSVYWKTGGVPTPVTLPTQIGFIGVKAVDTLLAVTPTFSANTDLVILGKNRFGTQDFSTYTNIKRLTFADDSVTSGNIKLASTTVVVVGTGASLPSLNGTGTLNLVITDRLMQTAGTNFNFTNGISVSSLTGNSVSLWLTSRANQISQISGNTNGGSISVVTNIALRLTDLNTGGGSVVVVNSGGGLSSDSNVNLGSVGFRVAGAVDLQGKIASASGSASSVNLASKSAGFVVGNVSSDNGVVIAGDSSSVILTGTVTSRGSSVEVQPKAVVAGTVELYSASRVELATVNSISQTLGNNLRVAANTIVMKGPIGSPTAKLGWVEFIAPNLSNPQPYAINYNGGPITPTSQTDFKGPRWGN